MTTQKHTATSIIPVLTAADRAEITKRAVAAAVAVARDHGVQVTEPRVLADRYAVRVHLQPAPLVARISTFTAKLRPPIAAWLARELAVSSYLAKQGAPVVPPSTLLPPGPYERDGFGISFWRYVQPSSDEVPGPEVAGAMLAELHAALRGYPGELPLVAPPLNDIPRGLQRIAEIGTLMPAADLALLQSLAERWLPSASAPQGPVQPLHGDAHAYNLIPTASGPLWNDFEDTCRGPIAWDLSTLADAEGKMLAAYGGAVDAADIQRYRQLRLLHGAVWVFALLPEVDEWAAAAKTLLDTLRAYA